MKAQLDQITYELKALTRMIRNDNNVPKQDEYIATVTAFNTMRSAMVALDVALNIRHNERYPLKLRLPELGPTEALET